MYLGPNQCIDFAFRKRFILQSLLLVWGQLSTSNVTCFTQNVCCESRAPFIDGQKVQ